MTQRGKVALFVQQIWRRWIAGLAALGLAGVGVYLVLNLTTSAPQPVIAASVNTSIIKGWQQGKGWGWIWRKDDEIGSLNAMTDASRAAALGLVNKGEVFDLGLTYSRNSYRWFGHNPGEIITFRSPDGIARMQDKDAPPGNLNPDGVFWHSAAMFLSDNIATQIDSLSHITAASDYHWYNGFKEGNWGGDWGPRADATTIPPIIARGILLEEQGAIMVGSDTSGFEVNPSPDKSGSLIPVHKYLLVDQGVHIGELHNLEGPSQSRAYVFCYIAATNKIKGTAAGFALRPLALR